MTPFVLDGDIITLAPLTRPPAVGDIVAFVRPGGGSLVVHRVIGRRGHLFDIAGDNDPWCTDSSIPIQSILGRIVKLERQGRTIRTGLGPERRLVALLARFGVLQKSVHLFSFIFHYRRRRQV